ncbi:hypothetical protein GCM10010215_64890 [Streptomyces virginiae]|uniref:Secreted protein n=1 Tax=Streptomyces virginiae TaxID=1961 RepID=A0ABQ3NMK9_STRVG|nr:hypothetical protein GCM10010215_64890 [Streptomyces virginiae]GHI14009.1 hypothetical protein Scinn_34720 [Streptomyces virginiae]
MSVSIAVILVVVAAVIAVIALVPAVAPAQPDQTAGRSGDEDPRRTGPGRPPARRLRNIPPQQSREHRRSFG